MSITALIMLLSTGSTLAFPTGTASVYDSDPGRLLPDENSVVSGDPVDHCIETTPGAPPVMSGWPQTMNINSWYPATGVVLADLEGDGDLEVLAGSTDNNFYAWDHLGVPLSGWPVNMGGQVQSKAAVADLDGDGDLEILIAVKNGYLHVLHHDGSPMTGWPQYSGLTYGFISPSLYNLTGDATPEILISGGSTITAWHPDGSIFWQTSVSASVTGTLAIGDAGGDDNPEIAAVTLDGKLHLLHHDDGTTVPGWPVTFGLSNSWAAPSIGDMDNDGDRELAVVGYEFSEYTSIFVYHGDGTPLSGYPVTWNSLQTFSCPVLADLDGDGNLELLNAGKASPAPEAFYAWDHTGVILPGWPVDADPNMEGSAIIADVDGNPGLEILIGDNWGPGEIFGYHPDGSDMEGFPIPKYGASIPNSPELADVDQDGDLDMAMTMTQGQEMAYVALWDFPGAATPEAIEWGGLFHDNWNTNQYGFVVPTGPGGVHAPETGVASGSLLRATPNPFHTTALLSFTLYEPQQVSIRIYDSSGRLVRVLLDDEICSAGAGSAEWDGMDGFGREVGRGLYLARLETLTCTEAQYITLLR
ncbi:MAG: FG-GAP-like repeat-containing protein [Candidatus Fermentibacteria bacterium]